MTDSKFSNSQLSPEQLPRVEQQEITPLQPMYHKANFFIRLTISLLLITALTIAKFQTFSPLEAHNYANINWLISGISLLGLWWLGYGYFADHAKGYAIREQDISFYSGVIFKKIVTQPLLRLQHIELKRGPIERKADLATIQVFSAGGALHTFELPGLSFERAQELRQFILDHKDVTFHE